MAQPLYTVVATSQGWPNTGSQAERALNLGYLTDANLNSTGGETSNISPSTASAFTSTGDQTEVYKTGRRLRIVHGGASTDTTYCEVASAVLTGASTATTVTIRTITAGATALSTSAIAAVGVSPVWASSSGGNIPTTWESPYLALGTTPATTGVLRLPNATSIYARNGINTQNHNLIGLSVGDIISIGTDASNNVVIGGELDVNGAALSVGATPGTVGVLRLPQSTSLIVGKTTNGTDMTIYPSQFASTSLAADLFSTAAGGTGTLIRFVSLPPGTWDIRAHMTVNTTGAATYAIAQINDGTNIVASSFTASVGGSTATGTTLSMSCVVSHTSLLTYTLALVGGSTLMRALSLVPVGPGTTAATILNAVKIG